MSSLKIQNKKHNLLYAEMLIALLFFVISFVVIIRVFAAADNMERHERRREQASLTAQSAAEIYSVGGSIQDMLKLTVGREFPEFSGYIEIPLDENFRYCEEGKITMLIGERRSPTEAGAYSEVEMAFTCHHEEFYVLKFGAYVPDGGAENDVR